MCGFEMFPGVVCFILKHFVSDIIPLVSVSVRLRRNLQSRAEWVPDSRAGWGRLLRSGGASDPNQDRDHHPGHEVCVGPKLKSLKCCEVHTTGLCLHSCVIVNVFVAFRTQNVLGEKGRRIRELTAVVQKRFGFPEGSVEVRQPAGSVLFEWTFIIMNLRVMLHSHWTRFISMLSLYRRDLRSSSSLMWSSRQDLCDRHIVSRL